MILFLLRLSSFFVFFARGYEHIFFDSPYRALFWDQSLLEGIITAVFKISWQQYATSPKVDSFIESFILIIGLFYIICSYLSLTLTIQKVRRSRFILVGSFLLFCLSLLKYKEHFYQTGQLLEMVAQWSSPLFLYLVIFKKDKVPKMITWMKFAIALTFLGHGLYAIGYYPVPGKFIDMIRMITNLSEEYCILFLKCMGSLDLLVFILSLCFILDRFVFSFAMIWGGLTSLARLVATSSMGLSFTGLHSSLYETLYRLPHFLLPLIVLLYLKEKKSNKHISD